MKQIVDRVFQVVNTRAFDLALVGTGVALLEALLAIFFGMRLVVVSAATSLVVLAFAATGIWTALRNICIAFGEKPQAADAPQERMGKPGSSARGVVN